MMEPEPSEEEAREAAALAAMLDGRGAPDAVPKDVVQAAAILRHGARPLDALRARALRDRVAPKPRTGVRFLVAGAAAAALVLVLWTQSASPPSAIPAPDEAVLAAQADAARGQDRAALDRAMRAYRKSMLAAPQLHAARAVHATVDDALAKEDVAAARAALDAFLSAAKPEAVSDAEQKALVQDALAIRASLEPNPEAALKSLDRGVALGVGQDVFGVNLLLGRAAAYRAMGDKTKEAEALHEALLLSDALLGATLGEHE